MIQERLLEVIQTEHITESAYILRFERDSLDFTPGQYICLAPADYAFMREYSIYSGISEPYLEVLIKEVAQGDISRRLKICKKGDKLRFKLSHSSFIQSNSGNAYKTFIATGTGISPFHSYVKSIPDNKNVTILHGISSKKETYGAHDFDDYDYTACSSKDLSGHFNGRVTDYLRINGFNKSADFYLCGNGKMIYEVFDILQQAGVKAQQVNYEIYF